MFRSQKTATVPSWNSFVAAQRLNSVDAVYARNDGDAVTRSDSTEVRRIETRNGGQPVTLFIKKYWVTKASQLWSGMFRGTFFGRSKVRREFDNLCRLRAWGLDAPAPIAYGEERRGRFLVRSFLISEGIANPLSLDLFIRDYLPSLPRALRLQARLELVERLADYTRKLHERGFVHHDLFWRNIILSGRSLDTFALIDAHKGRLWRSWAERQSRAQDLATLDAPAPFFFHRTERLRFFLRYRQRSRLREEDKALARLVLAIARPLREKQRERVRRARS